MKKIQKTFDAFISKHYLNEYYARIGLENRSLLEFFVEAYKDISPNFKLLELGGGPTIYQLITASKHAKEIHFSDHVDANLDEVRGWKKNKQGAFNWRNFFREAIILEGETDINDNKVKEREKILRKKITKFLHCDVFQTNPLGENYRKRYDVVSVNFVAESITDNHRTWKEVLKNICSLIKHDGYLIMTAIKGANYYHVGDKLFPAVKITEKHINTVLQELGFREDLLLMRSVEAEHIKKRGKNFKGYDGMIFIRAKEA